MNPATAFATVLVDELCRGGVREAVAAPGSRNAPVTLALAAAAEAGRLRLHVRLDERTAAFLALGLAKGSGRPVPVCVTSGTAAANLFPAVAEASHAGVPLLALTADRPAELRASGANQTTDQLRLFGPAVRFFADVGTPHSGPGQVDYWRALLARALAVATGSDPGPVQLNLAFREPLLPDGENSWPGSLAGRADGGPWLTAEPVAAGPATPLDGAGTVVVAGDGADPAVGALAAELGVPVLAEPSSGLAGASTAVPGAPLLLATGWARAHRPSEVLVTGRPTLSRQVAGLLADPAVRVSVLGRAANFPDPGRRVSRLLPAICAGRPAPPAWAEAWSAAAEAVQEVIGPALDGAETFGEPGLARAVVRAAGPGQLLVLGASQPIRDVAAYAGRAAVGARILANRGLSGIDGTVSTTIGAALGAGARTIGLLGDLTFLHDLTGLVIGPLDERPDVDLVVVANDGGGIFHLLEPGEQVAVGAFERVFAAPHGLRLAPLAAALGANSLSCRSREELLAALSRPGGLRVIEVRTDRRAGRAERQRLQRLAEAAVCSG